MSAELPIVLREDLEAAGDALRLTEAEHRHLCRVLRLRAGDAFELRDGRGLVVTARLERLEKRGATAVVADRARPAPPPLPELHLALPFLKGRRLDWALQKATELGVAGFHLYLGRHAVVRRERGLERYAEILSSAFCQSRRLLLPRLEEPVTLTALLDRADAAGWCQCWADELRAGQGQGPLPPYPGDRPLLAWIGPEGGFSAEERAELAERCERVLDLGPHVLRSETAAIAASCRLLLPPAAEKGPGLR